MDLYILLGAIAVAAVTIVVFIIVLKQSARRHDDEDREEYRSKIQKAFEELEYHELRRKGLKPEGKPLPEKKEGTRARAKRMIKKIRKAASGKNRKK